MRTSPRERRLSVNLAPLGNLLWQGASLPEAWRFRRDQNGLRSVQEARLFELIGRQAATPFGRRHRLGQVASYERFRDEVPLSTYETLLPYLAMPGGLSAEKVKVWEPTGGSTGGSKWIPWNGAVQGEFRRAVAVWIWHLFRQYPELRGGRSYWQLTPKTSFETPDWLPEAPSGFESDGDYLGPLGRWLEKTVLLDVGSGPNLWERTVRALLEAPDLRLISCWSPSFLVVLQQRFLEIRGEWQPRRWWPHLRVISCWTEGASSVYKERLSALFPGVVIQPKGLLSTEAVTTVPIGDRAVLAYRSHFFEFANDAGRVQPAWDLETGQEATVIVTTGAGLTRYDTGDRVRVIGHLGGVPCLSFLGRRGMCDQRGEKLSWSFLEELLEPIPGFAMLAFEGDGYVLFLDGAESPERRHARVSALEEELLESYTYRDARTLGQLEALRGFLIEGDALAAYHRVCAEVLGLREGSAKAQRVHAYEEWSKHLPGRFP